jgi:hypothetical protein
MRVCAFAASAASQYRKRSVVASDQRLFLLSTPALDLPFGRGCILQPLKMLTKNQPRRLPAGCIAVVGARFVLGQSPFKAADCRADIVAAVSTKQNVEARALDRASFETRPGFAVTLLRMTGFGSGIKENPSS